MRGWLCDDCGEFVPEGSDEGCACEEPEGLALEDWDIPQFFPPRADRDKYAFQRAIESAERKLDKTQMVKAELV